MLEPATPGLQIQCSTYWYNSYSEIVSSSYLEMFTASSSSLDMFTARSEEMFTPCKFSLDMFTVSTSVFRNVYSE